MPSLEAIAAQVNGDIVGPADLEISGVSKIEAGQPGTITFLANDKYAKHLESTEAAAVIVSRDVPLPHGLSAIRCDNPYFAFMQVVRLFNPRQAFVPQGIHSTAVIGKNCQIDDAAAIGPYAVIGDGCQVGARTQVLPHAVLGRGVTVGDDCIFHTHVSLREGVTVGNRVEIYDNTVVGSDGFGFVPHQGQYHKIPQVGTVVIEDDVEIGANVTIDRATMGETRIGRGVKLDNLIQVAHNCTIGPHTVIAAQTGVSGSTHIGSWCRIGGQVGFAGHQTIGNNVAIMAQSGVSKSLKDNEAVIGTPAGPARNEMRIQAAMRQLPEALKEIKQLKKQLAALQSDHSDGR